MSPFETNQTLTLFVMQATPVSPLASWVGDLAYSSSNAQLPLFQRAPASLVVDPSHSISQASIFARSVKSVPRLSYKGPGAHRLRWRFESSPHRRASMIVGATCSCSRPLLLDGVDTGTLPRGS